MGCIQAIILGGNVRSLVANDETEFKILTFRTYQKVVKLRDALLKGTIVTQLSTKLPESFVIVASFPRVFRLLGGRT